MNWILTILYTLILLMFLVVLHEFGHFIVGYKSGIKINEFSVGFGPKLVGFRRKGIAYSLRLIPLGGDCAFVGEDDENPAPNAMNNQPVWKRLLTVAAGPAMNFLLAFVFCALLLSNFIVAEYQPRIAHIYADTPAAECALEVGDVLVEINGTSISYDGAPSSSRGTASASPWRFNPSASRTTKAARPAISWASPSGDAPIALARRWGAPAATWWSLPGRCSGRSGIFCSTAPAWRI